MSGFVVFARQSQPFTHSQPQHAHDQIRNSLLTYSAPAAGRLILLPLMLMLMQSSSTNRFAAAGVAAAAVVSDG
jgi:hypothetical protein